MKMPRVLTDNIQRGYSLHESLVRGENWWVLGLISVFSSPLKRTVFSLQHSTLPPAPPPHSLFCCLHPPLYRAYWMCLKFKQDSKPSLTSPIRASLSCVWPCCLHKMESRQLSIKRKKKRYCKNYDFDKFRWSFKLCSSGHTVEKNK